MSAIASSHNVNSKFQDGIEPPITKTAEEPSFGFKIALFAGHYTCSTTKPFCDGTHGKIAFQAAERAVQQAQG